MKCQNGGLCLVSVYRVRVGDRIRHRVRVTVV